MAGCVDSTLSSKYDFAEPELEAMWGLSILHHEAGSQ